MVALVNAYRFLTTCRFIRNVSLSLLSNYQSVYYTTRPGEFYVTGSDSNSRSLTPNYVAPHFGTTASVMILKGQNPLEK